MSEAEWFQAAQNGEVGTINIMIKKGVVPIDKVNPSGQSALHLACYHNKIEVVQCLTEAGANTAIKDHLQRTPLEVAQMLGHNQIREYFLQPVVQNRRKHNYLKRVGISEDAFALPVEEMYAQEPKHPLLFLQNHLIAKHNELARKQALKENLSTVYTEQLKLSGAVFAKNIPPLSSKDVLFVIDMQNDFVPSDTFVEGCGTFAVHQGDRVAIEVAELITMATAVGCTIVASRDYHPAGHCSFNTAKPTPGPYPAHTVQGSVGACFVPPVKEALMEAKRRNPDKVMVAFHGYHESIDSYSVFPYTEAYGKDRLCHTEMTKDPSGCFLNWTGGCVFKCSNQNVDIDAPPDVMAVYDRMPTSLHKYFLDKNPRMFFCGLALDFCVMDGAIMGKIIHPQAEIFITHDATSAAYIAGVGKFHGGYLTDPVEMTKLFKEHKISFISKCEL